MSTYMYTITLIKVFFQSLLFFFRRLDEHIFFILWNYFPPRISIFGTSHCVLAILTGLAGTKYLSAAHVCPRAALKALSSCREAIRELQEDIVDTVQEFVVRFLCPENLQIAKLLVQRAWGTAKGLHRDVLVPNVETVARGLKPCPEVNGVLSFHAVVLEGRRRSSYEMFASLHRLAELVAFIGIDRLGVRIGPGELWASCKRVKQWRNKSGSVNKKWKNIFEVGREWSGKPKQNQPPPERLH